MADLKMLDCFCGMGGVSDGFALEGFDVTGIDIIDAPKMLGYKHRFIQADMLTLDGRDYQGFDVIWGSPPCRDFTQLPDHAQWKSGQRIAWKRPKQPQIGLKLVHRFLIFAMKEAQPKIWIMENVANLKNYIHFMKPLAVNARIWGGKRHVFYSNLEPFLIPMTDRKVMHTNCAGKLRSWERAKIPLACSRAFAKACKEKLSE